MGKIQASKDRHLASPLAYSPRSQRAAFRLAKMGKGGQRPPSDADKGLIASEYGWAEITKHRSPADASHDQQQDL